MPDATAGRPPSRPRAPSMRLWFGHRGRPLHLTATRHYQPEELHARLAGILARDQIAWLQVENETLQLSDGDLPLAARVAASYHNQICYNAAPDDGWHDETRAMEAQAEQNYMALLSDNSDAEGHDH